MTRITCFAGLLVLVLSLLTGCPSPVSPVPVIPSTEKEITGFLFDVSENPAFSGNRYGTVNGDRIEITVPYGTDVRTLVPAITHTGETVSPEAGVSTDFTGPVVYTVTAEDGTTAVYTVTVTVALNDAKEITGFSFTKTKNPGLAADAVLDIQDARITALFRYGTAVSALKATFQTTGKTVTVGSTVQVSGTTSNNFTDPVVYTVTAEDGTTKDYTVEITVYGAEEGSGFASGTSVKSSGVLSLGIPSSTLKMILAQDQSSITFPTSVWDTDRFDESGTSTLTRKFWMGETEVTNAVVAAVYQWAYKRGKFSNTVSDPNGVSTTTVKYGGQQLIDLDYKTSSYGDMCQVIYSSGTFTARSGYENYPACCMTWYGYVMFCNWLTEMRDNHTDNLVYTGIDSDWTEAETVTDLEKNGYRLPTFQEWNYAARYLGKTAPSSEPLASECLAPGVNGGSSELTAGYYWTPGSYASGAVADYTNLAACKAVAVFYDGINDPTKAAVKSLAPNALGIYDMCGNVFEITSDNSAGSSSHYTLGSDYCNAAINLRLGDYFSIAPDFGYDSSGFRLCRTAD